MLRRSFLDTSSRSFTVPGIRFCSSSGLPTIKTIPSAQPSGAQKTRTESTRSNSSTSSIGSLSARPSMVDILLNIDRRLNVFTSPSFSNHRRDDGGGGLYSVVDLDAGSSFSTRRREAGPRLRPTSTDTPEVVDHTPVMSVVGRSGGGVSSYNLTSPLFSEKEDEDEDEKLRSSSHSSSSSWSHETLHQMGVKQSSSTTPPSGGGSSSTERHIVPLLISVDGTKKIQRISGSGHQLPKQQPQRQEGGEGTTTTTTTTPLQVPGRIKHFVISDKSLFHPGLLKELRHIQQQCSWERNRTLRGSSASSSSSSSPPSSFHYRPQLVLHSGIPQTDDIRLSRSYLQHCMVMQALRVATQLFEETKPELIVAGGVPHGSSDLKVPTYNARREDNNNHSKHTDKRHVGGSSSPSSFSSLDPSIATEYKTEKILPGVFLTKLFQGPSEAAVIERCRNCFESVRVVDRDGIDIDITRPSDRNSQQQRKKQIRFVLCQGMKAMLIHRKVKGDPVKLGYTPGTKLWRRSWSVATPVASFCLPPLEGDQHLFFCAGCKQPMPVPCDTCVRYFCQKQLEMELKN